MQISTAVLLRTLYAIYKITVKDQNWFWELLTTQVKWSPVPSVWVYMAVRLRIPHTYGPLRPLYPLLTDETVA